MWWCIERARAEGVDRTPRASWLRQRRPHGLAESISMRSSAALSGVVPSTMHATPKYRCPPPPTRRRQAGCGMEVLLPPETLPACSISSTRAARRAASRAPTGFGQADAARARSVGSVTTDSPAFFGRFGAVLVTCVWTNSLFYRATRATCTCAFLSLSLSALLYGLVHHCSVSPCPTRASPPRARPRRAPARRRASPPSSARARSAPLSLWRPSCRPTA